MSFLKKIFGTSSQREVKAIMPLVEKIEALEDEYKALSDQQLQAKTPEFQQRLKDGETLDDILPEAFAACREAAWRVLGMRPYRVQLIGGIILHQGRIAEMKTGEGKTLVATLPAYLNALAGKGVHIVTVNDYLAKRDSEWMGKVYRFMGLTVGLVIHGVMGQDKKAAYDADITYGTNNEFGFDYLRDNMAIYSQELVQRGHYFAIVDEVDSILIDEARTPLIISGQGEKSTQLYTVVDQFVSKLTCQRIAKVDDKEEEDVNIDADYIVDEKARTATLTARGIKKAEEAFNIENLADPENTTLSHHINQAIKARGVMKRDIDYVVKDGQVIIVDEFTGRLMFGRRYNEGLHQAIEAKEHVEVANESKTLATITFQNYFRLYDKLSGMTGTAMTEEEEFGTIYELDIVEIPTNKPVQRVDHHDVVYKTEAGKLRAVVSQIEECHEKGQPVLVGTVSIEKSEELSDMLKRRGIKHNVLNAKNHEKEAEIVAQAGKLGAVTVATNMAGRGTDIMLGGNAEYLAKADLRKAGMSDELIAEATGYAETDNQEILDARKMFADAEAKYKDEIKEEAEKVREVGGLFILGTERHESRRIDNQLRGRAGRQGDPGESRFYLSLEDDIMRLFGSERVMGMMEKLGVDEDTPIEQKMLSNAIENAQKQVESRNFQTRKNVLQYDDVMNTQREVIYKQRRQVLDGEDLQGSIQNMIHTIVENAIQGHMGEQKHMDAESFREATALFHTMFLQPGELALTDEELQKYNEQQLVELVENRAKEVYAAKEQEIGSPLM
ncbi:MAG: preprotein translocase subunit SecA, partial [Flintibacter sp.]|uniref:preprotein translocase subunit SecA n=1 Tax=Flintibacter sp. TaxID=1918624 RepID=UPI002D7F9B04